MDSIFKKSSFYTAAFQVSPFDSYLLTEKLKYWTSFRKKSGFVFVVTDPFYTIIIHKCYGSLQNLPWNVLCNYQQS